jgi:hypothetical protein
MIERLVRRIIMLLLFVMILPTAVVVFGRMFSDALHGAISVHAPGTVDPVGNLVAVVLAGLFLLGLLVRICRAWQNRDAATARLRAQERRGERRAVRPPATDVPVEEESASEPEDPDPALPLGGV